MSSAPSSHLPTPVITGLVFPEGPRWRDGALWFSDMHGHEVRKWTPGSAVEIADGGAQGTTEVVAVVDQPSGLGFLPDGTPLVVSMRSRQVLRLDGATATVHADLSPYRGEFANDMLVDDEGRAYVGCRTHRRRGEPPGVDQLVLVHPDGSTELAADDVVGPNGTVLTSDGATLILAETQAHRITTFERDRDGKLGRRRVFAQLGDKVFPDGITLDRDGAVWAATGIGGLCIRVADGGEELERVEVSDRWITACTLGGADLSTLFLTTAATTLAELGQLNQATGDPHDAHLAWATGSSKGAIERVDVTVPGNGTP